MDKDHKPCISCKEAIKHDARKCPHCHQIQSGAAALQTHPFLGWVIAVCILATLAYFIFVIGSEISNTSSPPHIEIAPGKLRVSKGADNQPNVSCFASIKNSDQKYASDPSLQAEFFDSAGNVVDVHYAKHKFSLMPNIEAKAIVTGAPSTDLLSYASCKVSLLYIK